MKKLAISILIIIGSATAGYLLGNIILKSHTDDSPDDIGKAREEYVMSKLNMPVEAGDRLPDAGFLNLGEEMVQLKEIIRNRTIIAFIDHESEYSIFQLKEFKRIIECEGHDESMIIISKSPIPELVHIREEYGLKSIFLHDIDGKYEESLGIIIYPLNFIVDTRLVIEAIKPGVLSRELMKSNCLLVSKRDNKPKGVVITEH